jgi:hypothetical protein
MHASMLIPSTGSLYVPRRQIIQQYQEQGMTDARGNMRISDDTDIAKLKTQFSICRVCDRHKLAFLSVKAYKLHLEEDHAY